MSARVSGSSQRVDQDLARNRVPLKVRSTGVQMALMMDVNFALEKIEIEKHVFPTVVVTELAQRPPSTIECLGRVLDEDVVRSIGESLEPEVDPSSEDYVPELHSRKVVAAKLYGPDRYARLRILLCAVENATVSATAEHAVDEISSGVPAPQPNVAERAALEPRSP